MQLTRNDVFLPEMYVRIAIGNREFALVNGFAAIGIYNEDLAAFYLGMKHWRNYISEYNYLSTDGTQPLLPNYWVSTITPTDAFLLALDSPTFPSTWTHWIPLHYQFWSDAIIHGKFGDDSTYMHKAIAANDPGIVWSQSPTTYVNGYCAETGRDLNHVEQSFATEINAAEIALHQGIDMYMLQKRHLMTFIETHSGLRLGVLPPSTMTATLNPLGAISTFEIAYNHYHNRTGVALPNTLKIIGIQRQIGTGVLYPLGVVNPRLWQYRAPIPSFLRDLEIGQLSNSEECSETADGVPEGQR